MPQDLQAASSRAGSIISDRVLLTGSQAMFPGAPAADLASLTKDLSACFERYQQHTAEDPFSNPVLRLAFDI